MGFLAFWSVSPVGSAAEQVTWTGLLVAGTKYRGEFEVQQKCTGATTLDGYRKHIEKDPALERRFQPVKVPEPTVDETIQILRGLHERYELHHKLRYTDDALIAAAQLSYQYISDRFLPDKAIDLIDEAGSRVRLRHAQLPDEAKELDKELRQISKQKNKAVRGQDFEKVYYCLAHRRSAPTSLATSIWLIPSIMLFPFEINILLLILPFVSSSCFLL
ncbi:chaperone protein ClpC1, chloroplastic [Zea mays]|uniref:chaperone protein ClpC1, chloroplastic n=1 Tax=Zea mays TaxID=4577 RepID=UPI0004DE7E05|nr:chaperone protein ClpC1, chloroplastic [Zea mays]|eukprot:XP_008666125.1 chaperone protein ClpC1, chloroplastic [Zea mays]